MLKLDLSGLKAVILTHSHGDHFSLKALDGFLGEARGEVGFYCHEGTVSCLKLTEKELSRMKLHPLKTGDRVKPVSYTHLDVYKRQLPTRPTTES